MGIGPATRVGTFFAIGSDRCFAMLWLMRSLKTVRAMALSLGLVLGGGVTTSAAPEPGFLPLFDGQTMTGWRAQVPGHFFVRDGAIVADGTHGRSMLFFVGENGEGEFANFELRLKVRVAAGCNSGIYFRTEMQEEQGYPDAVGYEAQIANTHKNPNKTGSLFKFIKVPESPVKDEEWFDYQIRAEGRRIVIKINGQVTADYTEPEAAAERKPTSTRLGLQCHDPGEVEFKDIRIQVLP